MMFLRKLRKEQKMDVNDMELFNHKCPYTGTFCETFHCEGCPVEADERAWMEEDEEEE